MKKIAILASGSGTNAENLVNSFVNESNLQVCIIGTNKKDAYVIERAKKLGVPHFVFTNQTLRDNPASILDVFSQNDIDYLILAGFLLKIPALLIQRFPDRIINIHPSILPDYGGKGMYGMHVHEAVIKNNESMSGITIHLVNEEYDKGRILLQAQCNVEEDDTPENLAKRIHELEYKYFPKVVKDYIESF